MTSLASYFPAVYSALLPDFFESPKPVESRSDCQSCPLIAPERPSELRFNAGTRCCTYNPDLVNVLVGDLLLSPVPSARDGQRRVRAALAWGVGLTPMGLSAAWRVDLELDHNPQLRFGRHDSLRCPYYQEQSGQCSIWPFRDSVCATWHCRFQGGQDGRAFWSALQDYLEDVEVQLAREALNRVAPELVESSMAVWKQRQQLDRENLALRPTEASQRALWGAWYGREEELFRACAKSVGDLRRPDLDRLLGPVGREGLRDLKKAYQKLLREPEVGPWRLNPELEIVASEPEGVWVQSYSEFDGLFLTHKEFEFLKRGEGASVSEERKAQLWRFRVLIEDGESNR